MHVYVRLCSKSYGEVPNKPTLKFEIFFFLLEDMQAFGIFGNGSGRVSP